MNNLIYSISVPASFKFLRKIAGVNPLIINYHMVSNQRIPYVSNIYKFRNTKQFSQDIDFFVNNYNIINLFTLIESVKNQKELPKNSLLVTFDDGFKEIYEIAAPILKAKKVFPTVFVTKNFINNKELGYDHKKSLILDKIFAEENKDHLKKIQLITNSGTISINYLAKRIIGITYKQRHVIDEIAHVLDLDFDYYLTHYKPYLNTNQINELISDGFTFGGHSIDHPNFSELSIDEQIMQAEESMSYICNMFKINYRVFAFPYWDAGISTSFFKQISADLTFGTQGLLNDVISNNLQRISVEKYNNSAKNIIKVHYTRKFIYNQLNKGMIKRPV